MKQLSVARDFSSGFMPDRDYRSLTVFLQHRRCRPRWAAR